MFINHFGAALVGFQVLPAELLGFPSTIPGSFQRLGSLP